jgi:hypothetical protein
MKGYIINVQIKNYSTDTFLYVDENQNVRSIIDKEGLKYSTEEERWSVNNIQGTLEGMLEKGLSIGVIKQNKLADWNGHQIMGKIINIREVNIEQESKKDQGIAGLTKPLWKPSALN